MRQIFNFSLVLLLSVVLVGCAANKKKGSAEVEDSSVNLQADATSSGLSSDDSGSVQVFTTTDNTLDLEDPLGTRVIYFEFDSNALTPEAQRIVEAHAEYLAGNPGMAVVLEGHADERGTREYNLALGERRANAVADLFQMMGVMSDAVRSISYGEERPVAMEHDESAWSLNRRVEILY